MSIRRIVAVGIAVAVLVSGLGVTAVAGSDPGNAGVAAAQPWNEAQATNATIQVTSSV